MSVSNASMIGLPILVFLSIYSIDLNKFDVDNDNKVPQNVSEAQKIAELFEGVFPKKFSDGTHISKAKVEGDIVAFTTTFGGYDDFDEFSATEIKRLLKNSFCSGRRNRHSFFKRGAKIRLDYMTSYGTKIKGTVISKC